MKWDAAYEMKSWFDLLTVSTKLLRQKRSCWAWKMVWLCLAQILKNSEKEKFDLFIFCSPNFGSLHTACNFKCIAWGALTRETQHWFHTENFNEVPTYLKWNLIHKKLKCLFFEIGYFTLFFYFRLSTLIFLCDTSRTDSGVGQLYYWNNLVFIQTHKNQFSS